jgi:hypothetical protein
LHPVHILWKTSRRQEAHKNVELINEEYSKIDYI